MNGTFASLITESAGRYGVDPALVSAVINQESAGNPAAIGRETKYGTAKGLMQLLDSTAADMGVRDPFDPKQNIEGGTKYLSQLLNRYNGDQTMALAAYNFGPANVDAGKKWPQETRDYVTKIMHSLRESGPQLSAERRTDEGRPILNLPDGSIETEKTITVTDPRINGGKATNIPTIYGGKHVSEDEAADLIAKSGGVDPDTGRRLQGFESIDEAVSAARERSAELGRKYAQPKQAPTIQSVLGDARFLGLPEGEQVKVLQRLDARFAGLPEAEQTKALTMLKERGTKSAAPTEPTETPKPARSWLEKAEVAASGFNEGVADFAGLPVDLFNEGMKMLGIPMPDKPVMGSAFIKKYIMPEPVEPQTPGERILARMGKEVGANVIPQAGIAKATATASARVAKEGATQLAAPTKMEVVKNLPALIVEELSKVPPATLALIETGLAASAGLGAGVMNEIFPEGGPIADFIGELIGGVGPSATLGLIRKSKEMATTAGRKLLGLETEQTAKERIGDTMSNLADPEKVNAGVEQADKLSAEIPGFKPTTGQATGEPGLMQAERGFERSGAEQTHKFATKRKDNQAAVREYVDEAAPKGTVEALTAKVEKEAARREGLFEIGTARAKAKIDAAEGRLSAATTRVVQATEQSMAAADQRASERLLALKSNLTPQQAGKIIRDEYQDELGKFRAASETAYENLDPNIRMPMQPVLDAVKRIRAGFNPRVESGARIPDELLGRIERLGVNHELQQRALKAQADLEMTGPTLGQRGGFRLFEEQQGQGSTPKVTAIPSQYPQWYKSLTNRKMSNTENTLDRETIEKALDTIATGNKHGLQKETIDMVKQAINADSEFRSSPFFDKSMDVLHGEATESYDTVKRLRSEILTQIREAKATGNDPLQRRLNQLLESTDGTIDSLATREDLAALYPEAHAQIRQTAEDYAKGAQRLKAGMANRLRQKDVTGRDKTVDEDAADLFMRGEASINDFVAAIGSRPAARNALQESAKLDFYQSAVDVVSGKVKPAAALKWMQAHEPMLKEFPELRAQFADATKAQQLADDMTKTGKEILSNPEKFMKLTRPDLADQVDAAEKHAARVAATINRTKKDFEKSTATLFLGEDADRAAAKIVNSQTPATKVSSVLKIVGKDPEALAGFQKAMWDASLDKFESKAIDSMGKPILQARNMREFLQENRDWMEKVFGAERVARLDKASEAMEMLERTGRVVSPGGSDTAANLMTTMSDLGPLLSRFYSHQRGIVSMKWLLTERVARTLQGHFSKMSEAQVKGILDQAFFDPKVAQTLMLAGRGASERLIQTRLHTHLLNMNQLDPNQE